MIIHKVKPKPDPSMVCDICNTHAYITHLAKTDSIKARSWKVKKCLAQPQAADITQCDSVY